MTPMPVRQSLLPPPPPQLEPEDPPQLELDPPDPPQPPELPQLPEPGDEPAHHAPSSTA
jgi:hypothetical protein